MARRRRGIHGFVGSVTGTVLGNVLTYAAIAGVAYWGVKRVGGIDALQRQAMQLFAKITSRPANAVSPVNAPVAGFVGGGFFNRSAS